MISKKKGPVRQSRPAQVYGRNRPFNRATKAHLINDFVAFGGVAKMRVPARICGTKPESARSTRGESVERRSAVVLS